MVDRLPQQPQAPTATIYSVAERAGVSIATVSRVVRGTGTVSAPTRTKVLEALAELGYVPSAAARSLAARQHEALGLILPELSGPYYSELLLGFEGVAAELDLRVVLCVADRPDRTLSPSRFTSTLAGVDALAVFGGPVALDDIRRAADRAPVVLLAADPVEGLETFSTDNVAHAAELTGHLVDVHGRSPVFAGDPTQGGDIRQRWDGFASALLERGRTVPDPLPVDLRESAGIDLATRLLAEGFEGDALVCANDEVALAVMDRFQRAGRSVPDDLAVVGWDDIRTSRYVRPGLTTVRQPVRRLGEEVARRLHARVAGAAPVTDPVVLDTELVLRGSCGCLEDLTV
jgi:LacI family transcriptional regulator